MESFWRGAHEYPWKLTKIKGNGEGAENLSLSAIPIVLQQVTDFSYNILTVIHSESRLSEQYSTE